MTLDRRSVLSAGIVAGIAAGATAAGPRAAAARPRGGTGNTLALEPGSASDQAGVLQSAIDEAASRGEPLELPPGRFRIGSIELRPRSRIIGASGGTTFEFAGGGAFITADHADGVLLEGLVLDGAYLALDADRADGLIAMCNCRNLRLNHVTLTRSPANGISLAGCSGSIADCTITSVMQAAIRSLDAGGLEIAHNDIADCANNGIQVWRSEHGEDGSIVTANRIARIRADGGGTGENGNGINVFRAGGVLVTNNRIADCAYTAVRGNAASDIQIIANSCARLGEVALYAEFGFEGALIANNLIDTAATGISVTNFNDGGRLAVVQGNLVRNLFRREQEPVDKRGHGITVEADTALTGNVVEGAPTAGIVIGWGAYMREVIATSNLVRNSRVGILVSADRGAGACMLANNMISGATDGAIRAMDGNGNPTGADLTRGGSNDKLLSIAGNLSV